MRAEEVFPVFEECVNVPIWFGDEDADFPVPVDDEAQRRALYPAHREEIGAHLSRCQ